MAKDLVCAIEVEESTDCAETIEYNSKRNCFYYEVCREEFLKDSAKYLQADEAKGLC